MKSALNGGLNLSIRDGWWDEWYDGQNGWEIPTADGVADEGRRDDLEANALYDLIEQTVRRRFHERDENGIPTRWVEMVRHTPQGVWAEGAGVADGARLHAELTTPPAQSAARTTRGHGRPAVRRGGRVGLPDPGAGTWPQVRITEVDSSGLPDTPLLGSELTFGGHGASWQPRARRGGGSGRGQPRGR